MLLYTPLCAYYIRKKVYVTRAKSESVCSSLQTIHKTKMSQVFLFSHSKRTFYMKNNLFFAENEFSSQSLPFYPRLCIKFCCFVYGMCNLYMVLPLQAKESQMRQGKKSRSQIDPRNMPSNNETSIFFTAVFGIIVHFTHLVYCVAKKFCSSISIVKVTNHHQ